MSQDDKLRELRDIQLLARAQVHDDNCYPSSDMRFWTYIGTRFGSKEQERREKEALSVSAN